MSKTDETIYATVVRGALTLPHGGDELSRWATRPNRVVVRGDELAVTPQFIEQSKDRFGDSPWPGIIDDIEEQVRRWGEVRLVPGRLSDPENLELAQQLERERAEQTERDRQALVIEARRYGRRYVTSREADVAEARS